MKTYITSDLHLYHKNMAGPNALVPVRQRFKDEIEMTEYLIKTHNEVVNKDDVVYNLGDLSLHGKPLVIFEALSRMKGSLIIVKGNHDNTKTLNYLMKNNYQLPSGRMKFEVHEVGTKIKVNKKTYYLTHFPFYVGQSRGRLRSIHGHLHQLPSAHLNHFNVSIDSPDLPDDLKYGAPILLSTVIDLLEEKVERGL